MADADDLAAVWGPDGLASTDPGAIRTDAPGRAAPSEGGVPSPEVVPAGGSPEVDDGDAGARRVSTKVAAAGAVVAALAVLVAVVGIVVAGPGRPEPDDLAAGAPATTAVSRPSTVLSPAEADLLRRRAAELPPMPPVSVANPTGPASSTTVVAEPSDPARRDAEAAAAAFSTAMNGTDCDALWNLLSARSRQFLASTLAGTGEEPQAALCEALRAHAATTTVRGPARAVGTGTVVVAMASGDQVEDITFVLEDGTWRVDLLALQAGNGG